MSASPVHTHTRAFVSSKRRRPAPLSLEDEDDELNTSNASSARSTPSMRSTPRRSTRGSRPAASPAAGKPTWSTALPSSRSRHAHNLSSNTAAAQDDKSTKWSEQSQAREKDELGEDGQINGSGREVGGGRRLGLQISVGDDDGKMVRAHSSPPSLLNSIISHSYRASLRDSDEDSPSNGALKRQRTACSSPSQSTTPPCLAYRVTVHPFLPPLFPCAAVAVAYAATVDTRVRLAARA